MLIEDHWLTDNTVLIEDLTFKTLLIVINHKFWVREEILQRFKSVIGACFCWRVLTGDQVNVQRDRIDFVFSSDLDVFQVI